MPGFAAQADGFGGEKEAQTNPIFKNKEIVLLSCSDMNSAQNLAEKLGSEYKIIAWSGDVTVYENGFIRGE